MSFTILSPLCTKDVWTNSGRFNAARWWPTKRWRCCSTAPTKCIAAQMRASIWNHRKQKKIIKIQPVLFAKNVKIIAIREVVAVQGHWPTPPPPPKKWKKIDPFFPVHCKHLKIVMLPRCLFLTSQLTLYEKNTLRNEMFADEGTLATDAELWKWSHCTLDEENSAKLEILTGKKRRLEINR